MDIPHIGQTAGEYRAQGGEVDADVPDCAVFQCEDYKAEVVTCERQKLDMVLVPVRPYWSWYEADITVRP